MKISVFYHHVLEAAQQSGIPVDEILKSVKSFGVDFCELDFADIKNDDGILNLLAKNSLGVSSVYCHYGFNNGDETEKIKNHISRAKEVGSKNVMIIPGFYSGANQQTEDKIFLEGTRRVCEAAVAQNICPLIEDFDSDKSPIAKMEQLKNYADNIVDLRIAFDTGNFMYSGQSEMDAFDLLKDKIVHLHCKDRSLKSNGRDGTKCVDGKIMYPSPVGFGEIRMREIVTNLLKSNYSGFFVIEHYGAENQLEYIKKSADFLNGFSIGNL